MSITNEMWTTIFIAGLLLMIIVAFLLVMSELNNSWPKTDKDKRDK